MTKLNKNLITVFLGIFTFCAPVWASTFTNQAMGIEFEVSSNWTASVQVEGEYVTVFPLGRSARNEEGPSISISIERSDAYFEAPTDVEEMSEYFRMTMMDMPYTLLSEETTTFAGYPAREIIYTDSHPGVDSPVKHKQIYVPKNGEIYVFGFMCVENEYDAHWQDAKLVFDTLRLN